MDEPTFLAQKHIGLPDDDDRLVPMSNRLARAAQGLNLPEKRLVALGLAQSDSGPASRQMPASSNMGRRMRVTAQEYADAFNVDVTSAYEQLQAAADKLFDRYVKYKVPGRRGKTEEKKFRWVSSCTYAPGEGYVELNFSPEIAPHLVGLSYKLRLAADLGTVYAWRLFELLLSWQGTGTGTRTFKMPIEEFWEVIEAPPSCRQDFKALRVRVIEPSVAAIKAKSEMHVEWTPIRAEGSRRVAELEFRFRLDPQGRLDLEPASADSIDPTTAAQEEGADAA
jgi:plasmid replication initiation protein